MPLTSTESLSKLSLKLMAMFKPVTHDRLSKICAFPLNLLESYELSSPAKFTCNKWAESLSTGSVTGFIVKGLMVSCARNPQTENTKLINKTIFFMIFIFFRFYTVEIHIVIIEYIQIYPENQNRLRYYYMYSKYQNVR